MTYADLYNWIQNHCPPDRSHEEFIERLAIGSVMIIEQSAKNSGLTVNEVLDRFVWPDEERKFS